jgi:hypothetical protein
MAEYVQISDYEAVRIGTLRTIRQEADLTTLQGASITTEKLDLL